MIPNIGGTKKSGKGGRGAPSKVPVLVAVETRPKGCAHGALSKLASFAVGVIDRITTVKEFIDTIIQESEELLDGYQFLKG